jgi:LPS-assembly lipoprotein
MLNKIAGFAAATLISLGLSGCFQPLHGPQFGAIRGQLANVEVAPIEGHLGHQLKSELDFLLTNGTPPTAPQYRLTARPTGSPSGIIIDNLASMPQTMQYPISANYTLVSIKDGKVISTATAQTVVSFDRDAQRFATIRAQRDAEIRGAKILAEQIRARVIGDLAKAGG